MRSARLLLAILGLAAPIAALPAHPAQSTQVHARFSAPPGITLEIGVGLATASPRFVDSPVLARVTSDEDALVHATLQIPQAAMLDAGAVLWARVASPGYARRVALRSLSTSYEADPTKVRVRAGGTLFGRVQGDDGRAIVGARVWLSRDAAQRLVLRETRTDGSGRFAVDFLASERHTLHVRSNAGSTRLQNLELDASVLPSSVRCQVGGGVRLEGRIVDPDGAGVPGARLVAIPSGNGAFPLDVECYAAESDGGLLADVTRTARGGSFAFPALLPGVYDLHIAWRDVEANVFGVAEEQLGERLASLDVRAGRTPVELHFEARRVEALVLDAHGQSPAFAMPSRGGAGSPSFLSLEARSNIAGARMRSIEPIFVDGLAVFPIGSEHEHVLAWTESAVPYFETTLDTSGDAWRARADVVLGQRGGPATLTIRVLDPLGELCVPEPLIRVTSRESGREIASYQPAQLPPGDHEVPATWTVEVPPGAYAVAGNVVPDREEANDVYANPVPRPLFVQGGVNIRLAADERRTFTVRLERAGFLDFHSIAPYVNRPRPLLGRDVNEGGFATLTSTKGRSRVIELRFETPGAFHGDLDWIVPGWSARCHTPIPVGVWRLRVERADGVQFTRQIVIKDASVTVVRW